MSRIQVVEDVVFCDTDSGGVVSNIAYLRFVEKARCALFAALGLDLGRIHREQRFPTVTRTEIDYLRPALPGDRLRIEAEIASIERVRIHCRFAVSNDHSAADDPVVFARAKQVVVILKMPGGKPERAPIAWHNAAL